MRNNGLMSSLAALAMGCAILVLPSSGIAQGPIAAGEEWLYAEFDDLALGPITTDGAAVGEPVEVTAALDAIVTGVVPFAFPTNSLRLERNRPNGQASARFEFIQSEEATDGVLFIEFKVRMAALDELTVTIHGQGGNDTDFGELRFLPTGSIEFEHGITLPLRDYDADDIVRVSLAYDLNADAIAIGIDGVAESRIASAGIAGLAEGIGAAVFRRPPGSIGAVHVDDITTRRVGHAQSLLFTTFNGIPLGPLDAGSPEDGRPTEISPVVEATVVPSHSAFGAPSHGLSFRRSPTAVAAAGMNFEFLDSAELTHGVVSAKLRVVIPDDLTEVTFGLRQRDSGAHVFGDITLTRTTGSIHFKTEGTTLNFIDTYDIDRRIDIHIEVDLDNNTAAASIDGVLLVPPTPMTAPDPADSLGRLMLNQGHLAFEEVLVDDIDVTWYLDEPPEVGDRIFSDDFEGNPN